MPTVIGILDSATTNQRTDVIVVADAKRRRLLWVPRDLWSFRFQIRVNAAYQTGGFERLFAVLAELGLPVDEGVVFPRSTTAALLAPVRIEVPVDRPLEFRYPDATAQGEMALDWTVVRFDPPSEVLEGRRVHEWLGARYSRLDQRDGGDLARIHRQRVLVESLLDDGCDIAGALRDAPGIRTSDGALDELRKLNHRWEVTFYYTIAATQVGEQRVLLPAPPMRDGEFAAAAPELTGKLAAMLDGP